MFKFTQRKDVTGDMKEIINKLNDDYHLSIIFKPDGVVEIFVGTKRTKIEDECNKITDEASNS